MVTLVHHGPFAKQQTHARQPGGPMRSGVHLAGVILPPQPSTRAAIGREITGRTAREKWASVATSLNSRRVAATATARHRSRNATASSAPASRASAPASSATAGASAGDGPGSSLQAPRAHV